MSPLHLYDISRVLQDAPLYPGTPPPRLTQSQRIADGDAYNLSSLSLDLHTATHADAFLHYLDGTADIAQMQLTHYIGSCIVLSVPSELPITAAFLKAHLPSDVKRLLLHGGGAAFLDLEAAAYLCSLNLLTVGTDAWSIAPLDAETPIHRLLLGSGIAVLEQLDLHAVPDGSYFLSAAPLKLKGAEAAPCRAVLCAF